MLTLLGEFEKVIEPLIPPGHEKAIDTFKSTCREKINGLAYEGIRALKVQPGDQVGDLSTDLAERFAFNDTEATETT
jgi:hypothetical protein